MLYTNLDMDNGLRPHVLQFLAHWVSSAASSSSRHFPRQLGLPPSWHPLQSTAQSLIPSCILPCTWVPTSVLQARALPSKRVDRSTLLHEFSHSGRQTAQRVLRFCPYFCNLRVHRLLKLLVIVFQRLNSTVKFQPVGVGSKGITLPVSILYAKALSGPKHTH